MSTSEIILPTTQVPAQIEMTAGSFTFFLCKQPLHRNITKSLDSYMYKYNVIIAYNYYNQLVAYYYRNILGICTILVKST